MGIIRIYLDADGLLDLVTPKNAKDQRDLREISAALDDGRLLFITSELTIAETLVHAVRNRDGKREALLRSFLTPSAYIETRSVSLPIIEDALALRANYNLRTPDAIHIATGAQTGCREFLTKDEKWSKIGLTILTVAELAVRLKQSESSGK